MADKIFPLFSQNASATMTLGIDDDATAKTHEYIVDSRTVLIDAAGADAAPTHTVNIQGEVGLVFFVDITSLNKDSDTAAATVVFSKGDNTITFDAATEAASVMITETGLQDATDLLIIGATSGATFV
jgi:hypothetical protein